LRCYAAVCYAYNSRATDAHLRKRVCAFAITQGKCLATSLATPTSLKNTSIWRAFSSYYRTNDCLLSVQTKLHASIII